MTSEEALSDPTLISQGTAAMEIMRHGTECRPSSHPGMIEVLRDGEWVVLPRTPKAILDWLGY